MSDDMKQSLQDVQNELNQVDDDEEAHGLRERISDFIERIEHEGEDLRDDLMEQLIEAENALSDRYPGVVASLRRAINIMSNSGI